MVVRTTQAKVVYNGAEHVIVKRIEHSMGNVAVSVGFVPAGAIVVDSGAVVTTLFAGSTPQVLDIGTVADPNGLATLLVLTTAGRIVADEMHATDDIGPYSVDTEIVATLSAGVTTTAGVAYVYVRYIPLVP